MAFILGKPPDSLDFVQSSSLRFKGGTREGAPNDIHFKPDGTKLFMVGNARKSIYEYSTIGKTVTIGSGSGRTGTNPQIGYEAAGDGRQFSGGISKVLIYNRALTEEEILYTFNVIDGKYNMVMRK